MLGERPDWYAHAACAGTGPDLFYPSGRRADEDAEAAITICRTCTVRLDCAQHALNTGEEWGIWGGLNEETRLTIRSGRTRIGTLRETTP